MENAENPQEFYSKMVKKLDALQSPIRTANNFGIEEIIDPRETRPMLCNWISLVYDKLQHSDLSPKSGSFRP